MTFILTAEIDFVSLLPFAAFGAIAIGAWVLVDIFFNSKTKSESRLERMKNIERQDIDRRLESYRTMLNF